jgi:hypothetical protein
VEPTGQLWRAAQGETSRKPLMHRPEHGQCFIGGNQYLGFHLLTPSPMPLPFGQAAEMKAQCNPELERILAPGPRVRSTTAGGQLPLGQW